MSSEAGYVLLLTLITAVALFIALSGIMSISTLNLSASKRSMYDISALDVAESGADNAIFQINLNPAYTGTNSSCPISSSGSNPITQYSDSIKGKGTYESCVTSGSISHELIVYVTGKVYRRTTDTSPIAVRKLKLVVEGSPAGQYSVQTGPGGLIMSNSATIANGPINVGGYLTMSNTATIGSATSPIAVNVANDRCPSPATASYPQICDTNDHKPNPITMNNPGSHIYGNVSANEQSNGAQMSNTGLVSSSGVTAPVLPTYNRSAQKSAVTSTVTAAAASCNGNTTQTWAANLKISGNVTLANNCITYVSGNVWITGNFTMTQKAIIKPAATVTTQPVIMVDGSSGISLNNQSSVATNASSIGIEFITFYSTGACAADCATLSGTDLFNSQTVQTINIGNQGAAPGAIFYAYWSEVTVGQGGTIGAILGQTVNLGNSGNLSFIDLVSTGNYTYDVRYYEQQL